MRTLLFPEPEHKKLKYKTSRDLSTVCSSFKSNSLYEGLHHAYNFHEKIKISPDNVYNTICCIWAKYINLNAEKFRNQIVTHEGQKTIRFFTDTFNWTDELVHQHFNFFISEINKDQENSSIKWMNEEFSTTDNVDKFVRKSAMLASQKAYYRYESMLMCWFPEIVILGELEEWNKLKDVVNSMPTYDAQMKEWQNKLVMVIDKFIACDNSDEEFWQAPFTCTGGGSGSPDSYTGWATVFNPFNEKGEWNTTYKGLSDGRKNYKWYNVAENDLLNLTVDFDIELYDMGGQHIGKLKIDAGPTVVEYDSDYVILKNKFNYKQHNNE